MTRNIKEIGFFSDDAKNLNVLSNVTIFPEMMDFLEPWLYWNNGIFWRIESPVYGYLLFKFKKTKVISKIKSLNFKIMAHVDLQ